MSASIDTKVVQLRPAATKAAAESAESPAKSILERKVSELLRWLSGPLCCGRGRLIYDEIGDVYCSHCGKDFSD